MFLSSMFEMFTKLVVSMTMTMSMSRSMMMSLPSSPKQFRSKIVNVSVSLCFRMLILIKNNLNGGWSLSRVVDFQESIRMLSSFLTLRAEVKVFPYRTLVSWSDDWANSTTITRYVQVLCNLLTRSARDLIFFKVLLALTNFLAIVKLLEDLSLLLFQFSLDHLFEYLSGHALLAFLDILSIFGQFFASLLALAVLIFRLRAHVLIVGVFSFG